MKAYFKVGHQLLLTTAVYTSWISCFPVMCCLCLGAFRTTVITPCVKLVHWVGCNLFIPRGIYQLIIESFRRGRWCYLVWWLAVMAAQLV